MRFVTQVTLYAKELGVAIAQTSIDTGESHERAALKCLQKNPVAGRVFPTPKLISC